MAYTYLDFHFLHCYACTYDNTELNERFIFIHGCHLWCETGFRNVFYQKNRKMKWLWTVWSRRNVCKQKNRKLKPYLMFHKRTIKGNLKPLLEIFESCLLKASTTGNGKCIQKEHRTQISLEEHKGARQVPQQDCKPYTLELINSKITRTIL